MALFKIILECTLSEKSPSFALFKKSGSLLFYCPVAEQIALAFEKLIHFLAAGNLEDGEYA